MTAPPFIVTPDDTTVVDNTPVPTLTLTTCHPKGSARQRLVVQAQLQGEAVQA
jgi:sortase (surface protein transpeptidase)